METDLQGTDLKYVVQRKDNDFYTLRNVLLSLFPYMMVPPLPKQSDASKEDELQKRQKIYQRFLKAVCKSEVLKSCNLVTFFLKTEDRKDFDN